MLVQLYQARQDGNYTKVKELSATAWFDWLDTANIRCLDLEEEEINDFFLHYFFMVITWLR